MNKRLPKQNKENESTEFKLLKSSIGQVIRIIHPYSKTRTGKLIDVNPTNLTLVIENDNGTKEIIPYSNRHIYSIQILGSEE